MKTENCLNCGEKIGLKSNFCSQCGQKNSVQTIGVKDLFIELIETLFNFDTRLVRTAKPFLLQPGMLTNAFNEGKRMRYVNPLKLYFVMSLFFFFVFSKVGVPFINETTNLLGSAQIDSLAKESAENQKYIDTLQLKKELSKEQTQKLLKKINVDTTIVPAMEGEGIQFNGAASIFSLDKWKELVRMAEDRNLTTQQFITYCYHTYEVNLSETVATQFQKICRNDFPLFMSSIINNIPLMMMYVLPLFAFCMVLFYPFSNRFYIEHLIFTLHLQAFSYFVYGVALIFLESMPIISIFLGIVAFVYAFIAFRRVYRQSWIMTFFKISILSSLYLFTVLTFFFIDLIYSFYTF